MVAGLGGDHRRVGEMRRRGAGVGELAGELAEHEVLAAPLDEPERGDVPEHRRAAVAEHDLPPVGQGEQLGEAAADVADEVLDRRLAVRRADDRRRRGDDGVDLLGSHLRRSAAEPAVGGQQLGGDHQRGGVGRIHCVSMAA